MLTDRIVRRLIHFSSRKLFKAVLKEYLVISSRTPLDVFLGFDLYTPDLLVVFNLYTPFQYNGRLQKQLSFLMLEKDCRHALL